MAMIADFEPITVSEMRNRLFYRKMTYNTLYNIVGTSNFALYGFQLDSMLGTQVTNEAGSVAADMTLSNVSLWSTDSWYTPPAPKCLGRGLVNTGGASATFGQIPSSSLVNLTGKTKFTALAIVNCAGAGGGGAGRIFEKTNCIRFRSSAATTLLCEVYNGAGWVSNSTTIVPNVWHIIAIVYDGTQVGDTNRLKLYVDGRDDTTSVVANIPASLVEAANSAIYVMNDSVNNRALDGRLGMLAWIPDVAMTQAQIRSLIEIRGAFQPVAGNQPAMATPGIWGGGPGHFYSAAALDCLVCRQLGIMGNVGGGDFTWLVWGAPTIFTATLRTLLSLASPTPSSTPALLIRGTATGLSTVVVAAETAFTPWTTQNLAPFCAGITRRGGLLYGFFNGEESTNSVALAGDPTKVNFAIGCDVGVAGTTNHFDGIIQRVVIYDRSLSAAEYSRVFHAGYGAVGPRFLPKR